MVNVWTRGRVKASLPFSINPSTRQLVNNYKLKEDQMNLQKIIKPAAILLVTIVIAHAQSSLPKPGADFQTFMSKGIWTWYGEPKAVYYKGTKEKTYISYFRILTNPGNVEVASYDHQTGQVDTFVLKTGFGYDDHNHPSIIVRNDGRIMAFYCMHYDGSMKMRISTNPEDVTSWGPEKVIFQANCTYPNIIRLANEGPNGNRIFVFYRGVGDQPTFVYSDDGGTTWSGQIQMFVGASRPYSKFDSNGKDRIHMIIERDNRNNGPQPSFYMCYRNNGFYRANGTLIKTLDQVKTSPVTTSEAEMVYNPAAPALDSFPTLSNLQATCWDVGFYNDSVPVFLFDIYFNNANGWNHLYHYYRWNGSSWRRTSIVNSFDGMGGEAGFSGGLTLDHAKPNIIYVSRQVTRNTPHEVERWTSPDSGKTWSQTPLTSNSADKNTRPCVPRGYTGGPIGVIWMYGAYSNWFGPFTTDVKMYSFDGTTHSVSGMSVQGLDKSTALRVNKCRISFSLVDPSRAALKLYTVQGRLVENLSARIRGMRAGENTFPLNSLRLAAGAYTAVFCDGRAMCSRTIVVP
jgi:hypothetical protein